MSRIPAKLWKLALVAALAAGAFTFASPRSAEALTCGQICMNQFVACREACLNNCRTRVPCYSDCVDACVASRVICQSHC